LQIVGDLPALLNGRGRYYAGGAGGRGVFAGRNDIVAKVFYRIASAQSRLGIVLVDDAGLIQAPGPRPVVRADRVAPDGIVARSDLLAVGRFLHALAWLLADGIALVDGAVTRDLLVVSRNRVARRDRAQGEFAFADLEVLRLRRNDGNCGQ